MRTPRLLAVAAAASLALLSACGTVGSNSSPDQAQEPKPVSEVTIGFAQRQMDAPYYAAMEAMAQERARAEGFHLLFQNAGGDPVTQLNQVQAMLAQGVDALVVNAISPETQRTQLEQAAGEVPVLFVDTSIPDVGLTAVQSNNKEIGRLSGLLTAQRFGSGATIQVAILNGGPNDEIVGPARQEGFLAGLTEGGVTPEVVASATATYTQEEAVPATESMLAAHPETDLVLGLNDSMALGALSVLRNQGNSTVLVAAAADGQKEALAEIANGGCTGQYVSTGLNSPSLAAEQVFDIAVGVATGQLDPATVQKISLTQAAGIGCENVSEYYDPSSVF
ncbi:monosaccharide ABC transporter substrate-binding protein (CUT2 family) [Pseudonocardia hierapolitana]|uniref:Monosaccharide ABC transporter substrate-binding protein (CUT2 family) n=1 Tax=Pseudonocardia hierapolitana TaxID=1128676 RepID=A0A561SK99_9PSEU|nr:substrate-binding domain-containing protein [Pseudonocardia hierapolitana]TWF75285.1 monosaccharide ABC transporter substrate-binding protein (CUT2 family) [Pseudonocardia hierapolitana]